MPTALLSVYDKTGVVDLARGLADARLGRCCRAAARRAAIADAGLPVTDVAELTGFPAILGHRVVTLHPKVHGGILADLDDPDAPSPTSPTHGIEPIALVVVNLYPFATDPGIELIDIGGPAMVRAAAKNHAHVGVVVDPADYGDGARRDRARRARCRRATRRRLARDAFAAHRGLRRGDRRLARRRAGGAGGSRRGAGRAAGDADAAPRAGRRTCATARTRTSRRPATAASAATAGGTTPCSTAARS